jgi:DNA-binding CsgD family transcriptional regulator/tetratricopeptide (TPR) repeat protein
MRIGKNPQAGEIKSLRQALTTKHPPSTAYVRPRPGSPAAVNASTASFSFSSHSPKAILEPMTGRVTSASLVGRQEELGRLHLALQSVAAGEPTTVLIAGEAGVGKTRLVEEFAAQVDDYAQVLLGRCLQLSGGGLPYGAIIDALRDLTRNPGSAGLEGLIGPASDDLRRLLPGAAPTRSTEPISGFAQSRLFESILRFLDRLAQEQPVVLIIEDVHWADRSTLDLLMFLVRVVRHERLLVAATYRSDELHPQHPLEPALAELDRNRHLERLELVPFDRGELSLLLGGILGRPPSPATVQHVLARSGGNAFLAEELLAAERNLAGQELPRRLHSIMLARVTALGEDTRHLLRLAATAGRPIEHHLLAAAAQLPEERLLKATREAVDRQVLRTDRDIYRFRHVLLQQAVYGELLPGERVRLHTAVARALTEDAHARALRQTSAELAQHWYIVRDYPRALTASISAARAAAEVYGFTEAYQHYERALNLWEQVPDAWEQVGLTLSDLRLEAAEAAGWTGLADRAATLIQEALVETGPHIEPARAGVLRARQAEWLSDAGDHKAALATYEEASRLVAGEPPSAGKARVLAGQATELMRQGQYSASRAVCEDALAVARAVGALAEEGRALNTLGCVLSELGDPEAGITSLRRALSLCEQAGSFDDIHTAYLNLSYVLGVDAGRPHEGLQALQQGLARLRELGLEFALPSNTLRSNLAGGLWSMGRWREAEKVLNETQIGEMPSRFALALPLLRAHLHLVHGQFDLAHEQAQVAVHMAERLSDLPSQSSVQSLLAELAIWRGDAAAARSAVAKALQYLTDDDHSFAIGVCRIGLRTEADAAERARDRRATTSEVADIQATGQRLLDRARESLARIGGNLPGARVHAAGCEAEFTRLHLRPDPDRWAELAATCDAISRPYEAAYARWRQAEALIARKAPGAAAVLRQAYHTTVELGEVLLRRELERLAQRARIDLQPMSTKPPAASQGRMAKAQALTPREQEVLGYLMEGRTNRQIARALFITEKTASVHVSNIMGKLGAANRSEAAAIAHRLRLLVPHA